MFLSCTAMTQDLNLWDSVSRSLISLLQTELELYPGYKLNTHLQLVCKYSMKNSTCLLVWASISSLNLLQNLQLLIAHSRTECHMDLGKKTYFQCYREVLLNIPVCFKTSFGPWNWSTVMSDQILLKSKEDEKTVVTFNVYQSLLLSTIKSYVS